MKASRAIVDDLSQMWSLDDAARDEILQALWTYYATFAVRAKAHRAGDTIRERGAYQAGLMAWSQLFECIDQYAVDEIAGAWKVLLPGRQDSGKEGRS